MSGATWQELKLATRSEWLEPLEDWLFAAGAVAVTLEDGADQPLLEPGPGETPLWDNISLVALFPAELPMAPVIEALPTNWLVGTDRDLRPVAERDWERAWMDTFHPMPMGERLWVCPSWREPPDPSAINLILDPGLAFGTGTHPTTAMCLSALDRWVSGGERVVDYGCGSGILAIAALKLGAAEALGVDNDPQALTASRANAARNDISAEQLTILTAEAPLDPWRECSDLVVANILANPLVLLAPRIAELLRPGGRLLLAGLLEEQAADVAAAYAAWVDLAVVDQRDEWVLLGGVSPGPTAP